MPQGVALKIFQGQKKVPQGLLFKDNHINISFQNDVIFLKIQNFKRIPELKEILLKSSTSHVSSSSSPVSYFPSSQFSSPHPHYLLVVGVGCCMYVFMYVCM